MRKINLRRHLTRAAALLLVLAVSLPLTAFAAEAPCEGAAATGHYRHPVTGIIEDSGGESSEALGQSMVDSVVTPQALVETGADGTVYVSLRFNLMSNISSISLATQKPGDPEWTPVGYESTGRGADTEDCRIPFPGKDGILRCRLFVDAMGRAVVFYVTLSDFTEGNPGGFARMEADYVPELSDPEALSEKPVTRQASAAPIPQAVPVQKDGEVLGLVVGGQGAPNVPEEETTEAGEGREIIIGGRVWLMFFLLVFCAQLLACFVFWGLRTLICGEKSHRQKLPQADAVNFDDGDDDWMEFNDEDV